MISVVIALLVLVLLTTLFVLLVRGIGGAEVSIWGGLVVMIIANMASRGIYALAKPLGTYEAFAVAMLAYVVGIAVYLRFRHEVPFPRGLIIGVVFSIVVGFAVVALANAGFVRTP
jgi:ABC-type uncharacterized transport system permease subunit